MTPWADLPDRLRGRDAVSRRKRQQTPSGSGNALGDESPNHGAIVVGIAEVANGATAIRRLILVLARRATAGGPACFKLGAQHKKLWTNIESGDHVVSN